MKTIDEYAIDLVCSGAESTAEDDLNEEEEIADADHQAACDLAIEIAHAIRANPQVVLELAAARHAEIHDDREGEDEDEHPF
jgi:hypothetical protein